MTALRARARRHAQGKTVLLASGLVAPLIYAATVIIGGAAKPGYSHIANVISELIEAGRGAELQPWFLAYNLLVIAYAWGMHLELGRFDRRFAWGAITLGLGGALGLAMIPFPMDPVGSPATVNGMVHLAIAGLMSLSSMATLLLFALGWQARPGAHNLIVCTITSLAVVFVSGGLAAAAAAGRWPSMGLLERITIGTYLLWMFVTAAAALRNGAGSSPEY